jgi:hypothetical protein
MRPSRSTRRTEAPALLVVAILAWGILAIGAVYAWAYVPLAIAAAGAGVYALALGRRRAWPRRPAVAFLAVAAAVLAQQVPLPPAMASRISPRAHELLTQYDLQYAAAAGAQDRAEGDLAAAPRHPLSIDPRATWIGLGLLLAFGVFLFGLSAALDGPSVVRLARGILAVGLLAALAAIVQKAAGTTKVYGVWQPHDAMAMPFGSFVNRNHFAGWMLMAFPLGLGYFIGLVAQAAKTVKSSWRARLVWVSTPAASGLILSGFALVVMAAATLLSSSRSGAVCLAAGVCALAIVAARGLAKGAMRLAVVGYLAVMATACATWIGLDPIASRFEELGRDRTGDRQAVWHDALALAGRFPLAGTGLNTFGPAMLVVQTGDEDVHYREAHSDYLQLAAEGGFLVGVPALLLVALTVVEVRRRLADACDSIVARWTRIGAVVGMLTIALQEAVDFSLQMPGNAALFAVVAAIALHRASVSPAHASAAPSRD